MSLPELFLPHSCLCLQIYSPESKGKKKLSLIAQIYGYKEKRTQKRLKLSLDWGCLKWDLVLSSFPQWGSLSHGYDRPRRGAADGPARSPAHTCGSALGRPVASTLGGAGS